jgi:DNA polymerase-3 subunit epsilon
MSETPYVPMTTRDLLVVDIETSGLDPFTHEIIELAAVRLSPQMREEKMVLEHKIKMTRPEVAEAKALEVNRYTPAEWQNAAPLRVALVSLVQVMAGPLEPIVVGHNPTFDLMFLRVAFWRERLQMPDVRYTIDTATLAWPLCSAGKLARISLESICAAYGVANDGSHRAMADVRRTIAVYKKMMGITC